MCIARRTPSWRARPPCWSGERTALGYLDPRTNKMKPVPETSVLVGSAPLTSRCCPALIGFSAVKCQAGTMGDVLQCGLPFPLPCDLHSSGFVQAFQARQPSNPLNACSLTAASLDTNCHVHTAICASTIWAMYGDAARLCMIGFNT